MLVAPECGARQQSSIVESDIRPSADLAIVQKAICLDGSMQREIPASILIIPACERLTTFTNSVIEPQ